MGFWYLFASSVALGSFQFGVFALLFIFSLWRFKNLFKIVILGYHITFNRVNMQFYGDFMIVFVNFDTAQSAQNSGCITDIARIESELFDDAWDALSVGQVLGQFGAGVLVADNDDDIMGYLIYQIVFEVAEILRIATDMDFQKQGVGQGLLDEFDKLCKEKGVERILLEVRADNAQAIRLYERHGFYQIDVRKDYYKDEFGMADALILQKDLG